MITADYVDTFSSNVDHMSGFFFINFTSAQFWVLAIPADKTNGILMKLRNGRITK
jgi:hypothetical protein